MIGGLKVVGFLVGKQLELGVVFGSGRLDRGLGCRVWNGLHSTLGVNPDVTTLLFLGGAVVEGEAVRLEDKVVLTEGGQEVHLLAQVPLQE